MKKILRKQGWKNHWKTISTSNKPIEDWLYTVDGNGKTLIDIGCGAGYLSEIAIERGFTVTSIDLGNTPYIHNIKKDVKTLEGSYDYLIAAGFPPLHLPQKLKIKNFLYTTSRNDFKIKYPGDLYFSSGIWIKTNLIPLDLWVDGPKTSII